MSERLGNSAAEAQRDKRLRHERQQRTKEVKGLLEIPEFRRFMVFLLEECAPQRSVIGGDPHLTYYRAGKQDVGHLLSAQLEAADAEAFHNMLSEEARRKEKEGESDAR